ncbi:hypothetical protein V8C42DRAFT_317531 [Trichoderma barbatum]
MKSIHPRNKGNSQGLYIFLPLFFSPWRRKPREWRDLTFSLVSKLRVCLCLYGVTRTLCLCRMEAREVNSGTQAHANQVTRAGSPG